MSFANSFKTSISKPSYSFVAVSRLLKGGKSPVVPAFKTPELSILFNVDSADATPFNESIIANDKAINFIILIYFSPNFYYNYFVLSRIVL